MRCGYELLTGKEKETLRLILRGHDAKSMASELDLSVHTINERLRNARRKLAVTSSKEAARLLFEREGEGPEFLAHQRLGEAGAAPHEPHDKQPDDGRKAGIPLAWIIGGAFTMFMLTATLALIALQPGDHALPPAFLSADEGAPLSASPAAGDAERAAVASQWLALLDAGDWQATWDGTASAFQDLNTFSGWVAASEEVHSLLGATISRRLVEQGSVPAPPKGYWVLRFQTQFAKRSDAVETIALVREDGAWKVVGITVS